MFNNGSSHANTFAAYDPVFSPQLQQQQQQRATGTQPFDLFKEHSSTAAAAIAGAGHDRSGTNSLVGTPTSMNNHHSMFPIAPALGSLSTATGKMSKPSSVRRGSPAPDSPAESSSGTKKGTKRPRPTLSCTECVRRKSKCDRTIPCSTCIKRGTPDRCRVEDEELRPSQPFALARELAAVKERVAKLENLLFMIAPDQAKAILLAESSGTGLGDQSPDMHYSMSAAYHGASGSGSAPLSSSSQQRDSMRRTRASRNKQNESDRDDEEEEEDDGDEAEDGGEEAEKAAFALESIAVAGRGPMLIDAEGTDNPTLPLTTHARIRESQLRQQELEFLLSLLPDWNLSRPLVDAFFDKVSWHNHVVHQPTFEAQYNALKELVEQHRVNEVDPAWLSLYFMVIASGLFFSPHRTDVSPSHQSEYTNTWVLGAQRALTLADWSGRPQLTCIQAVVLLPVVLMHAGGIKRLASWIAAALRMAQLLDLHKLDDRTRIPNSSPANSFGPVEKEIGKRLYFSLTHGEVNFTSRWLGLGQTQGSHHTPIPNILNVDDTDLLANPPVPKPIEQATVSSFQVIRARIMNADLSARLTGSDARVHKYETVLAFDLRTRELLDQLPAYFKYDRSDDPDIKALVVQRPYIAYQRCTILFGLNNRLLRAHRPFMTRGYLDHKYAYSTESCVKAAKVIIAAQRALRDIFDAADRMYNCLLYCFSSAVVLMVDNFHRLSSPGPIEDTQELDSQRHEALDVLAMLRRESGVSTIAQAGAKVLEGLLNEEGQRRTQRGLPAVLEDFSRNNTPDQDAPTLREVVERIASVSKWSAPPILAPKGNNSHKTRGSISTGAPDGAVGSGGGGGLPGTTSGTSASPSNSASAASPSLSNNIATNTTNNVASASPSSFSFSIQGQPPSVPGISTSHLLMGSGSSQPPSAGISTFANMPAFLSGPPGEAGMSDNESEDLLRSLGFFEVGSGIMPTMGIPSNAAGGASGGSTNSMGGAGMMGGNGAAGAGGGGTAQAGFDTDGGMFGMLGGSNMVQDLSWLDGLGEW